MALLRTGSDVRRALSGGPARRAPRDISGAGVESHPRLRGSFGVGRAASRGLRLIKAPRHTAVTVAVARASRRRARAGTVACLLATVLAPVVESAAQSLAPTTATGIGVWYQPDAPAVKELWRAGDPGERMILKVIVRDPAGTPVAGAQVELWQADGEGVVHAERYRARLRTADDGSISVSTVFPGYIWRARHVHLVITHPAHEQLVTRILFRGDPLLLEMEYPELAINLEEGKIGAEPALFGVAEIVLTR